MDAGWRELADVVLPEERGDAVAEAGRLADVRPLLDRAIDLDPDGAAHARYALGMFHLLSEHFALARAELERALSAFRNRPDVYTRSGLLDRADLHHSLAVCLEGGTPRTVLSAGTRLLESTTEELRIPSWMLESVLTAVGTADVELAGRMFGALVRQRGEDIVPTLAQLATDIPAVALAFLERSRKDGLSTSRRADAAKTALCGLLRHEALLDEADEALGSVLELAARGIGTQDAIQLLHTEERLTSIREPEELRLAEAELQLARGDRDAGVGLLIQLAQEALARPELWQRAEAVSYLERLEEFEHVDEVVAELRSRLDRLEGKLEPPPAPPAKRHIRLLVVGGNEMQIQYEEEIRRNPEGGCPLPNRGLHLDRMELELGSGGRRGDQTARECGWNGAALLRSHNVRPPGSQGRQKFWRSVGGHGRDGILRGIYRCASLVTGQQRLPKVGAGCMWFGLIRKWRKMIALSSKTQSRPWFRDFLYVGKTWTLTPKQGSLNI
ncbi:MAG: tetratricopeptide repeat protein [Gemmatimonadales bacterium]